MGWGEEACLAARVEGLVRLGGRPRQVPLRVLLSPAPPIQFGGPIKFTIQLGGLIKLTDKSLFASCSQRYTSGIRDKESGIENHNLEIRIHDCSPLSFNEEAHSNSIRRPNRRTQLGGPISPPLSFNSEAQSNLLCPNKLAPQLILPYPFPRSPCEEGTT